MGSHGTGGTRQLFSRPLLATALSVILVVALFAAWKSFGDRLDDGGDSAARCLEGTAAVPVAADPAIAPALQEIAKSFNATAPRVRDRCVTVEVRPVDARAMLDGLTAKTWDAAAYGAFPGAWIPESSVWSAALQTADPQLVAGAPESLVSSPVLLAVEPEIAAAADGRIGWAGLPMLTGANSLAEFGHGDWGSLRIAMPQGPQSDATSLAAQAVAAAAAKADGPLTAEQAESAAVRGDLEQLMSAPPRVGDGTAEAAVQSIAATTDPLDTPVRAVPITEQRLYLITKDDAKAKVAAVSPTGGTPIADYPVIALAGTRVQDYLSDATAEFIAFARTPEQIKLLTRGGFRGAGPLPAATATVTFGEITDQLPTPEPQAVVTINEIVLPSAAPGER